MFAADSMGLWLFLRNCFRNTRKEVLDPEAQNRPFKVTCFWITRKPTGTPYHVTLNAGLLSKVSENIASESTENCLNSNLANKRELHEFRLRLSHYPDYNEMHSIAPCYLAVAEHLIVITLANVDRF